MGGRTIYRALSPKRTPFQSRIDRWPHLWTVPGKRWISHTYPMWLWGNSFLRFHHLGQFFMEPSDYYDAPINKVLHLIRSVGLINMGSTIDHWWSQCKGRIIMDHPLCSHSFTLRPLYHRGKRPQYQLNRLGGPQSRSGHCMEEKNLFPTRNGTPAVQPVAVWTVAY
jgi:hypothetical protein